MLTRRDFLGTIAVPAAAIAVAAPILKPRESWARPAKGSAAKSRGAARTSASAGVSATGAASSQAETLSPADAARDEDLWREAQLAFDVDRSLVNLNNGGVSPTVGPALQAMKRHLDAQNQAPPYSMWRILEPRRETVRERMAGQWRCDPEEVAFTRNASESLQICQLGFDLKRGDEVLTTSQDYPRMITTFKQRERREGIVLRQFPLPIPAEDDDAVVRLFEQNVTERTRMILVSQVVNITGQILPVRAVAALGRRRGIPVVVDGAHGFAHMDFTFADLDCDYYASSLHKWLFAPIGTGLLYVRREKIKELWPLMAAPPELDADIRKLEEIGTHSAAPYLAIGEALTFHQMIGPARKEARLRYLRDRWAQRLLAHPSGRVKLHTSLDPRFSCGIGVFKVEGIDSGDLSNHLWEKRRILTTAIKHPEFEGIRVTPSVYTTLEEIDRFGDAVEGVLAKGLPKA